ncbi:hypothetical protein OSCT_1824 [Oscillochloris trichoides DG-6]|uniref:Uncharacterized protein n=1 Tax=Oscillochloris trichoides DG-6 TaxID=765420 RepID=E1IES3_9CHLR|nr:hypothetical protein [Oscillochloris trichoides]EFO80314.1 hypothetical protein OSCT_1824 [Oscillochloris trichoides DG-6]
MPTINPVPPIDTVRVSIDRITITAVSKTMAFVGQKIASRTPCQSSSAVPGGPASIAPMKIEQSLKRSLSFIVMGGAFPMRHCILMIMFISTVMGCSFSSVSHSETPTRSPESTPNYLSLAQTNVISPETRQDDRHTTPVIVSPINTPQILTNTTNITTQPELYTRIPEHFTSFSEPRNHPLCNKGAISSQKPLFSHHLSLSLLENIHYLSADAFHIIQLHEGYYLDPVLARTFTAPPAHDEVGTRLVAPVLYGDIDRDGGEDAVVMLQTRYGGSGIRRELAVILNHQPEPNNVATIYFGDRDIIKHVTIVHGDITIVAVIHQAGDGLCCPSWEVQKTFRLCQENLVQIPEKIRQFYLHQSPGPTSPRR